MLEGFAFDNTEYGDNLRRRRSVEADWPKLLTSA